MVRSLFERDRTNVRIQGESVGADREAGEKLIDIIISLELRNTSALILAASF